MWPQITDLASENVLTISSLFIDEAIHHTIKSTEKRISVERLISSIHILLCKVASHVHWSKCCLYQGKNNVSHSRRNKSSIHIPMAHQNPARSSASV
jgi:hypothetical protein